MRIHEENSRIEFVIIFLNPVKMKKGMLYWMIWVNEKYLVLMSDEADLCFPAVT